MRGFEERGGVTDYKVGDTVSIGGERLTITRIENCVAWCVPSNHIERDLSPEIKRHADAAIFFMGMAVGGLCTAGISLLIHAIRVSV